ncbi:hypothetical protein [Nocardioides sp. P5_E3]
MKSLRAAASRLMTVGLLSDGWYSILTGLALLFLAYVLGGVSWDTDPAANVVAIAFLVIGSWHLTRGIRAEFRRRPKPTDDTA